MRDIPALRSCLKGKADAGRANDTISSIRKRQRNPALAQRAADIVI